jgi:hypothetical protein
MNFTCISGMHRKVTEILGVIAIVFTLPLIASLGINEYVCFMSSTDQKDGLVCSKVVKFCVQHHSKYLKEILC